MAAFNKIWQEEAQTIKHIKIETTIDTELGCSFSPCSEVAYVAADAVHGATMDDTSTC